MTQAATRRSIASHFGIYATGNLLLLAAGFVTFPITTRALSAEDFGVLGYWEVWSLFVIAICKLGSSELIVRFFPHGGTRQDLVRYGTNTVAIPVLMATALWAAAFAVTALLVATGVVADGHIPLLALTLALLQIWATLGAARLAAAEHSSLTMITGIAQRWLTVAVTAFVLLRFMPTPSGALLARLFPCALVVIWLLIWIRRHQPMSRHSVDWGLVRKGLQFSAPLGLKELSNIVLVLGNRVMLRWLSRSDAAVGLFTVGFSLAMYLEQILNGALTSALTPTLSRLYNSGGSAAVKALKSQLLVPVTHLAILGAVLIYCRGNDFVLLVSGSSKLGAGPVFVIAGICYLAQGVANIMGAGLLLENRTRRIFALTAVAAALNLLLNAILIPTFGIIGAAAATCGSQLLLQALIYLSCSPALRCLPPTRTLVVGGILAVLLVSAESVFERAIDTGPAGRIALSVIVALLAYVAPACSMEPVLRKRIDNAAAGLMRRRARP